ncbi:hypothetical protein C8R44DRAFT_724316 [Mycena epipterygia]|nr:hypothetical protein C8R44DRAFT_724316 [Mycena epipterygia]
MCSFTLHADFGSTTGFRERHLGLVTAGHTLEQEFGSFSESAFMEALPTGYLGCLATQTVLIDLCFHFSIPPWLQSPRNSASSRIWRHTTAPSRWAPPTTSSLKNLIVAVGSVPRNHSCAAGLIFVDVIDSTNPTSAGCAGADGYRPMSDLLRPAHGVRRINEDSFTIYHITDPAKALITSTTPYYGVSYSHQGWVVDERDQSYLLLDDELDEVFQREWVNNLHTVTYIWDIKGLTKPVHTGHYSSPVKSIDHNIYVHNGWAYESNYGSGLRIVDVSSVAKDPTGGAFTEVAFFDVHPEDDDVGGEATFTGSWSVYPYFESGYIVINSIERGLFVVKYSGT